LKKMKPGEQFLATFGNVVASTFSLRLLSDGLKLSVKKTEYLTPNVAYSGSIKVKGIELPRTAVFKYLESAIASDGKLMVEVNPRVSAAWSKRRSLTGVLCDKKIRERFKSKIYRAVVRPIAMYGAECRPVTKEVETSLNVMETKMLRWTAGVMRMAFETMLFGRSSVSRI
uniref:L51_S25_CI-B8 domain-containing protein n=1 Tax=Heligmosomoides polygyrus TaxID=6339 RepID=A0A183GVR1_HELPZ